MIIITKKMGRKTGRIGDLLQQTKQTVKKRINATDKTESGKQEAIVKLYTTNILDTNANILLVVVLDAIKCAEKNWNINPSWFGSCYYYCYNKVFYALIIYRENSFFFFFKSRIILCNICTMFTRL